MNTATVSRLLILHFVSQAIINSLGIVTVSGAETPNGQIAPAVCDDGDGAKIRIGLLYKNSQTGRRHREGLRSGIQAFLKAEGNEAFQDLVCCKDISYGSEDEGVGVLLKIIKNASSKRDSPPATDGTAENSDENAEPKWNLDVDLVLGPTESGVFVRALNQVRVSEGTDVGHAQEITMPVISGLVAAKEGNDRLGWFFRTNVDAALRADTIYNFLNKRWVRSIAVIHADSEFGRQSESAFAELLDAEQRRLYTTFTYADPEPPRASPHLKQVLSLRPEAVGFFGEREQIADIWEAMKEVNADLMPYNPLFFTTVDARQVTRQVNDLQIYCVSVTSPDWTRKIRESKPPQPIAGGTPGQVNDPFIEDDVWFLGHETALLVMQALHNVKQHEKEHRNDDDWPGDTLTAADRRLIREQLASFLVQREGNDQAVMRFTNLRNSSPRHVLYLDAATDADNGKAAENIIPIDKPAGPMAIRHKVELIYGAHSWAPAICAAAILLITGGITYLNLRQWFRGSNRYVFGTGFFFLLAGGHAAIVLLLYVVLAERGVHAYNSIAAVVALCLAPTALLRTTFFEVAGKRFGLERVYDGAAHWVENQLMKARYQSFDARKNWIAYSNSQHVMERALHQIYQYHPRPSEAGRRLEMLRTRLNAESNYFDRRRICAEELLSQLTWEELKIEGLLASNWLKEETKQTRTKSKQALIGRINKAMAHLEESKLLEGNDPDDTLIDPQKIIRLAARHCLSDYKKRQRVRDLLKSEFDRMQKEFEDNEGAEDGKEKDREAAAEGRGRLSELRDFYESECRRVFSPQGLLNIRIRCYFVISGFTVRKLMMEELLSPDQLTDYVDRLRDEKRRSRNNMLTRNYIGLFYASLKWCVVVTWRCIYWTAQHIPKFRRRK